MSVTERTSRMRRLMEVHGLDVLILTLPENILLLSGYWPMIGASVLVFPVDGPAACILPECYEQDTHGLSGDTRTILYRYGVLSAPPATTAIRQALNELARGRSWKRIGYEGNYGLIAPSWNSAEFLRPLRDNRSFLASVFPETELAEICGLIEAERACKTSYEIEKLRCASEISALGLEAFERSVAIGVSGVELAATVEREVMARGTGSHGARRVRAFAQVAVGDAESAVGYRPNEISTTRRLESGDVALLELGVVVDGYWADRTRVRVAGTPSGEQLEIFDVVRRAQEAAVAAVHPRVTCGEVDEAARSIIRDAGYEAFFPHVTGHGVGLRYHESSHLLAPYSPEILGQGASVTIEPGIYCRPAGGFRIEDDVVVTASGAEVLGPWPKSLC